MSLRPNHNKAQDQEAVEKHKRAFLAKGGIIEILPPMAFTYRLYTVSDGGAKGDLMLYADKYDAATGGRSAVKVHKWQRNIAEGGYNGV